MKRALKKIKGPWLPVRILILGLLASVLAMRSIPLNHVQGNPWGDPLDHFGLILGAAEALQEGQFPLREIPRVMLRLDPVFQRHGLFQFYGALPLTLAGALSLAGFNPWHAFLVVIFLSFLAGFAGIFRFSRNLGQGEEASAAAAAIYTLAPYHLIDLYFKGAFPELCVFGLLPWVFLSAFKAASETGARWIIANGLAWAALMLTHPIFHVWTFPFFLAVLALWWGLEARKEIHPLRALPGYFLGLALSLWFVLPGVMLGSHFLRLKMAVADVAGFGPSPWYDLKNLLAHVWVRSGLGLSTSSQSVYHLGWPIVAGFAAYVFQRGRACLKQPVFWLFLAAFLLAWGPVNYFKYLGPLQVLQIRFRLLVYATLFGSLLAGWSLAPLLKKRALAVLILSTVVQALLHLSYQPAAGMPQRVDDLARAARAQGVLLSHLPYDYFISPSEADRVDRSPDLELAVPPDWRRTSWAPGLEVLGPYKQPGVSLETGIWTRVSFKGSAPGSVALLPAAWYPGLYKMEINGVNAVYGRVGNRLAAVLPAGDVELRYRLAGLGFANAVSLATWLGLLAWLAFVWLKRVQTGQIKSHHVKKA